MRTYLPFYEDEILEIAVKRILTVYAKAYSDKNIQQMQKNIIDPFKFMFDTIIVNKGDENRTFQMEKQRQSDKTITNAIGEFHQYLLGNLPGFEETPSLPTDIRKRDLTVIAEVKNKFNTMNARSKEAVFKELRAAASNNPLSTCYLIEIISKNPEFEGKWEITTTGEKHSHPQVKIISAKKFYAKYTGIDTAFSDLFDVLPKVLNNVLPSSSFGKGYVKSDEPLYVSDVMRSLFDDSSKH